MKTLIRILLLMVISKGANATVLTFDDLTVTDPNGIDINVVGGTGYGGFSWSASAWILDPSTLVYASGFQNSVESSPNIMFNAFAEVLTISHPDLSTFDWNGAYFTAAWNNGLNIEAIGIQGNTVLYDKTIVADSTGPTWFDANFQGIDRLNIRSFGGTGVPGYFFRGSTHFAMDNFTFDQTVAGGGPGDGSVPEPTSVMLMVVGLLSLNVARHKRLG